LETTDFEIRTLEGSPRPPRPELFPSSPADRGRERESRVLINRIGREYADAGSPGLPMPFGFGIEESILISQNESQSIVRRNPLRSPDFQSGRE